MEKYIIDEQKTFEINPDYKETVEYYGPAKVVLVDDFYKNPDLVRELALRIPPSINQRIRGGNPAYRINAFYVLDNMAWIYDKLLRKHWPEIMNNVFPSAIFESFTRATFMINVMQSENLPVKVPHQDNTSGTNFASTIYLNTPEECAGGTSFYTYGGRADVRGESLDMKGTEPTEYITDSVGAWELTGIAEMKFNRMVLYNQSMLHTAYIKPGMFKDDVWRLNQQFFI